MVKRSNVDPIEVLRASQAFHTDSYHNDTPEIALADRYPKKVILAKMDQMRGQGLLEVGVSLRTAWPTEKGLALLAEAGRPDASTRGR